MGCSARRALVIGAGGTAGLALALLHAACGSDVFACSASEDCSDGGIDGACEASGYCSFPDGDCPSGARYGDHAGDSLAGECVPVDDATSATGDGSAAGSDTVVLDGSSVDGPTTGSDATIDPTTPADSTTEPPLPECGDGNLDPGETCDDDNQIDGDGCNADCSPSGTIVWEIIEDSGVDLADGAASIAISTNDELFVGGWLTTAQTPEPVARKLTLDGTIEWTTPIVGAVPWNSVYTWGVAVADDGAPAIAADGSTLVGNEWIVAKLRADGEISWQTIEAGEAYGVGIGVNVWACGRTGSGAGRMIAYALDDGTELDRLEGEPYHPAGGFAWDIAVFDGELLMAGEIEGANGEQAFARRMMPAGLVLGEIVLEATYDQSLALALGGNDRWLVGSTAGDPSSGWLGRVPLAFDSIEGPEIVTDPRSVANLHGVTVGPAGEIVVAGWQTVGTAFDALVQKYTPDGELAWSRTYEGGSDVADYARDVVVASDGTIVFVGHVGGLNTTADFWAVGLTP